MFLKNTDRTHYFVIEPILNLVDFILQPGKKTRTWVESKVYTDNEATYIIQPSPILEGGEGPPVCPSLSLTQNNKRLEQISIFLDHPGTFRKGTHLAKFPILTLDQTKHVPPINLNSVKIFMSNNFDDAFHYINNLLETPKSDEVNYT